MDDAKREAEKEEDTVDAIELGLLPWADCLKMVTYLKDMTEKMSDEEVDAFLNRPKGLAQQDLDINMNKLL